MPGDHTIEVGRGTKLTPRPHNRGGTRNQTDAGFDRRGIQTSFCTKFLVFFGITAAEKGSDACRIFLVFVKVASKLRQKEHVYGRMNDQQCERFLLFVHFVSCLCRKGRVVVAAADSTGVSSKSPIFSSPGIVEAFVPQQSCSTFSLASPKSPD